MDALSASECTLALFAGLCPSSSSPGPSLGVVCDVDTPIESAVAELDNPGVVTGVWSSWSPITTSTPFVCDPLRGCDISGVWFSAMRTSSKSSPVGGGGVPVGGSIGIESGS